ncbi:MAG: tetratricopeptide repeat protein [Ardenticatenia bacterium]|nr:tetratricopeptide repeat protein [Ardenticatenia bacterium]
MKLKLFHDIFDRRLRPLEELEYLAQEEPSADRWHQVGMAYFQRLQFHLALEAFNRVLQAMPHHVEARFHRGITLSIMGKFDQAIDDFSATLRQEPDHFPALYNRGRLLARLGRHEEALGDFRRALEVNWFQARTLGLPKAVRELERRAGRSMSWWTRLWRWITGHRVMG